MSSQLEKDIIIGEKLNQKANNSLKKIAEYLSLNKINLAIEETFNYENICEKITNHARLMPVSYGNIQVERVNIDNIIKYLDIKIKYIENNWFYVKMPALLPKKEKGNASYIRASLQKSLRDFFKTNEKIKIKDDSTIIIRHNYSKERDTRQFRDHDNIEINVVIDSIALFVLIDDNPLKCRHYYCSSVSESDNTEIFIVPNDNFKYWLDKYL